MSSSALSSSSSSHHSAVSSPAAAAVAEDEFADFSPSTLFKQGAEARMFKIEFLSRPAVVKERFAKHYRHPDLDKKLRKTQTSNEARSMLKVRKNGVPTPVIYHVDTTLCRIYMEWLPGVTVREFIQKYLNLNDPATKPAAMELATMIGTIVAHTHQAKVVHGDLTTSNIMLSTQPSSSASLPSLSMSSSSPSSLASSPSSSSDFSSLLAAHGPVVMIDFGLSYSSEAIEDKAVDLYVMERAFLTTHPNSEDMFEHILRTYKDKSQRDGSKVMSKLNDVRKRGRKRSMVG